MIKRISQIESVKIETISFSSQLQIGDSKEIDSFTRSIAVQREKELFFSKEGNFAQYPLFSKPIHIPKITESITLQTKQETGKIKVKQLNIIGVTTSSIIHIGSNDQASLENRTKHFRQLQKDHPLEKTNEKGNKGTPAQGTNVQ